jgi:hypothetical protein
MSAVNKPKDINSNNNIYVWILATTALILLFIVYFLLRSICSDAWYVKLLGLPSSCNISNINRDIVRNPTLKLEGNRLTISGGNTIVLPENPASIIGLTGPAGSNGTSGTNGQQGLQGAPGIQGPAGPADPCSNLTTYFCQNGNSFGGQAVFGTTDNNSISTIVNNQQQFTTRFGGIDINPNAATTNPDGNWYPIRINDTTNHFENGMYLYDEGTYQNGSYDTSTGFQANFFSTLAGNSIGYLPGAYMASYDGSTVQTLNWIAPNSYVIGNFRYDFLPSSFAGAQYAADYSANYVPLSLITLQDLTNALSIIPADNGLTNNSGTIELGGTLLHNTTLDGAGNDLEFVTIANLTIGPNSGEPLFHVDSAGSASLGDDTNWNGGTRITVNTNTNDIIFYTNNVERGRFESGGELLINTTTPVVGKVAVFNGDVNITGVIDPTALLFSDTTGSSSYDPATNNGYRIGVTGVTQRPIFISPLSDSTDIFQIRNSANVAFFSADSSNSRIGIGTSTPAQKLDVNGDAIINTIRVGLGNGALATNTAFGFTTLNANTSGTQNTGIGYLALAANTTATRNTAIGWNALAAVDIGGSNTAVGGNALALASSGSQNTAVGRGALQAVTSGGNNNGIGVLAMGQLQTGINNVAIGNSAMNVANGGSQNVVIGVLASITQTTASTNTIIGYNTGGGLTTGGANTIIGANVNGLAAGTTNNVIISDGSGNRRILVDSAGNMGIANTTPGFRLHVGSAAIASGTTVSRFQNAGGSCDVTPNVAGGITCTSDITLKKNIEDY